MVPQAEEGKEAAVEGGSAEAKAEADTPSEPAPSPEELLEQGVITQEQYKKLLMVHEQAAMLTEELKPDAPAPLKSLTTQRTPKPSSAQRTFPIPRIRTVSDMCSLPSCGAAMLFPLVAEGDNNLFMQPE